MPKSKKKPEASPLVKAKAARRTANLALKSNRGAGGGPMSQKERAGHQKAIAAADSVIKRTGKGKAPSSRDTTRPGKPTSKGLWAGLKALLGLAQLPKKEGKALKGVERKTRGR